MAISTTTNTVLLAGNSSTVVFPYAYPFYTQSDLQVYLYDTVAGGIVKQNLSTNYSVAGVADSTGIYPNGANVVFTSSIVNTTIVVIDRQPIETQTFSIIQNGYISSVGLTHQLDYLTLLTQALQSQLNRAILLPPGFGDAGFSNQLPSTAGLIASAGLTLAINSGASGFSLVGSSTLFPTGTLGYVYTANGIGITPTFQPLPPVSLSSGTITGTLSLGNGGTGGLIPSEWGVVYASSATQLATTAPGPVGLPLIANASSGPSYQQLNLTTGATGILPTSLGGTNTAAPPLSWGLAVGSGGPSLAYIPPAAAGLFLTSVASSAPIWSMVGLANGSGVLPLSLGGTGIGTSPVSFSVPYAASGTALSYALPGGAGQVLTANASSAPTFQTVTVGLSNGSGVLPIANGGTGQVSAGLAFNALSPITSGGDLIVGSGTNNAIRIAAGSSGTVLQSFGAGALPGWVAATSGLAYVSNQYGLVVSGSSNTVMNVIAANSSTSLPLIAQGTGANPAWGVLGISGGGTGQTKVGSINQVLQIGAASSAIFVYPTINTISVAASYVASTNDQVILAGSGCNFIGLFTAVGNAGREIQIKNTNSAGTISQCYLTGTSAQTIDGFANVYLATANESWTLVSDGTNWQSLGHSIPSDWTTYTPATTGLGSITSVAVAWSRIGDGIMVSGGFAPGTPTALTANIGLPGTAICNSSKVTSLFNFGSLITQQAYNSIVGDIDLGQRIMLVQGGSSGMFIGKVMSGTDPQTPQPGLGVGSGTTANGFLFTAGPFPIATWFG